MVFIEAGSELMGMGRFFVSFADKTEAAHANLERATHLLERAAGIIFDKAGTCGTLWIPSLNWN